MKVVSTNLGKAVDVQWKNEQVRTGIFKYPTNSPIQLGKEDVLKDQVVDRKYHGGVSKACYFFSADHYAEWKKRYPNLSWDYGMFGENITVAGMDENRVRIGDRYRLGTATIRITEPRQPYFKLGIRFKTQTVLRDFIASNQPGFYAAVEKEGTVAPDDAFELIEKGTEELTVAAVFRMLYRVEKKDLTMARKALTLNSLPAGCKEMIEQRIEALVRLDQ